MLLILCLQMALPGAPAPVRPAAPQVKKDAVFAKGRTVLVGTWSWDVGGNELGPEDKSDVFWEQVSPTIRNLVPQGGAGLAVMTGTTFEKISLADLTKAAYSTDKVSGPSLRPGTVLALRTRDGRFAKVKVARYRDSHDDDFPEAAKMPKGWIRFGRRKPKIEEYHLEVDWVLYRDKK